MSSTYNNENLFRDTVVFGKLINCDDIKVGGNQANAKFKRDVSVGGDLRLGREIPTTTDGLTTYEYTGGNIIVKINGIIYTITPTILKYISTITSDIQTQINNILTSNVNLYALKNDTTLTGNITIGSATFEGRNKSISLFCDINQLAGFMGMSTYATFPNLISQNATITSCTINNTITSSTFRSGTYADNITMQTTGLMVSQASIMYNLSIDKLIYLSSINSDIQTQFSNRVTNSYLMTALGSYVDKTNYQVISGQKIFSTAPSYIGTLSTTLNDGTLATTAWVKSQNYVSSITTGTYVDTTTTQTIAGVKTFSSIPFYSGTALTTTLNDGSLATTKFVKDQSYIDTNTLINTLTNYVTYNNKVASGGIEIIVGSYSYHIFLSNSSISFTKNASIQYLIIGGGGAGGNNHGGGGGAGEVIYGSTIVTPATYSVTVGTGGTSAGVIAGDSSVFSITAKGGGRGGGASNGVASSGGSGGGGAGYIVSVTGGSSTKTIGLGNAGGNGTLNGVYNAGGGGGGGGSSTAGSSALTYTSGSSVPISSGAVGGLGTNAYSSWISDISGSMPTNWQTATSSGIIASGGSAGSWYLAVVNGQPGGAGSGGTNNGAFGNIPATNAINYTGSGGGGGSSGGGIGGNGGNGLIVIRYSTNLSNVYVDTTTAQNIAGVKTFSSIPTYSGTSLSTTLNDGTLVTAKFVKDQGYLISGTSVDLTTNQTIGGTKTFTSTINTGSIIFGNSSVNITITSISFLINNIFTGITYAINFNTHLYYLKNVSSDIQTQFDNINTNLTNNYVSNTSLATTLISPAFTGTPTAPTQIYSDNSTSLATTQFVYNVLQNNDLTIGNGATALTMNCTTGFSDSVSVNANCILGNINGTSELTINGLLQYPIPLGTHTNTISGTNMFARQDVPNTSKTITSITPNITTVYNRASISLVAGAYMIYFSVPFGYTGTNSFTYANISISPTSATLDTNSQQSYGTYTFPTTASLFYSNIFLHVDILATTTYYGCIQVVGAGTYTFSNNLKMYAIRYA